MKHPKLLITGCNGRIGTILMKGLAKRFEIHGIDVKTSKHSEKSIRSDVSNYQRVYDAFRKLRPLLYVIHLAADPRVDAAWESVLKNNIIATRNIFEAAKENGVKRVIFASSNHVTGAYEGIPPTLHQEENPKVVSVADPIRPDGDYASSKAYGEAVARQYFELYGLEAICLRIGNVIADDDPTTDDRNRRTWLSHRDLLQLVEKSLLSKIQFGIYYGVSANKGRYFDISTARKDLGYNPKDDAGAI
jgi:nucleoside-diphosphate-sugar epimerase